MPTIHLYCHTRHTHTQTHTHTRILTASLVRSLMAPGHLCLVMAVGIDLLPFTSSPLPPLLLMPPHTHCCHSREGSSRLPF